TARPTLQSPFLPLPRRLRETTIFCRSALDDVDLDGFDADALLFKPLDGFLDARPVAFEFEADDADLIGHAALADVGDDRKFVAQFPDDGALDEPRRIHEPEAAVLLAVGRGLDGGFGFGGAWHVINN